MAEAAIDEFPLAVRMGRPAGRDPTPRAPQEIENAAAGFGPHRSPDRSVAPLLAAFARPEPQPHGIHTNDERARICKFRLHAAERVVEALGAERGAVGAVIHAPCGGGAGRSRTGSIRWWSPRTA